MTSIIQAGFVIIHPPPDFKRKIKTFLGPLKILWVTGSPHLVPNGGVSLVLRLPVGLTVFATCLESRRF